MLGLLDKFWETIAKFGESFSKRDNDTLMFGFLAVLVTGAVMVSSDKISAAMTGFGLIGVYILYRYGMYSLKVREQQKELKRLPSDTAGEIIDQLATEEEKMRLENGWSEVDVLTPTKDEKDD